MAEDENIEIMTKVATAFRDRLAADRRRERAFFIALAVYQNLCPGDPDPAAGTAKLIEQAIELHGDDLAGL